MADAAKVKALVKQRGHVKARLTRHKTYVDEFDLSKPHSLLSVRVSSIDDCWSEFDRIQTQLEELLADSDSYDELANERTVFEEEYFELKARIHDLVSPPPQSPGSDSSQSIPSHTTNNIRLPTIELPTFGGSYEEWQQYYDIFSSLIDSNQSLNKIQRFHYLKASLQGEALKVIHSLEISSVNYDTAWELLKSRFANKRIIINKHIQALFDLPRLQCESIASLRPLVDNAQKHLRALATLGEPTQHWDALLIHMITNKFDHVTRRLWETHAATLTEVKYNNLIQFLETRCVILESCNAYNPESKDRPKLRTPLGHTPSKTFVTSTAQSKCILCKQPHILIQCDKFNALAIQDRIQKARDLHICLNCLRFGHKSIQCKNPGTCRKCHKRHHTSLHLDDSPRATPEPVQPTVTTSSQGNGEVVLATAQILVANSTGAYFPCRVLLDSGSQSHFITEAMAQSLGLNRVKSRIPILGINKQLATASHTVHTRIKSQFNSYQTDVEFLVINKITGDLPLHEVDVRDWMLPRRVKLADPHFNVPRGIDALLGAEIFFELLCIGQIKMGKNLPIVQKTSLGWIVTGRVSQPGHSMQQPRATSVVCHLSHQAKLDNLLSAFWRIEECIGTSTPKLSMQEEACETNFSSHCHRTPSGRYSVQLPFSQDPQALGNSKDQAVKRFKSLERRLSSDKLLKTQYCDFLNEYLELNHMELVEEQNEPENCYYLPHHPVLKSTSTTTKLRVVFDASSKSSNGKSLNDILMVGPTIQRDLFSIILSFRMHVYAFTTDIKQMYRQILVDPAHTDYQRIVWRNNPDEELQTYRLTTVTYGTAAAPFLAVRSLHQLAEDEKQTYPLAAQIAVQDFYVDDLVSGSDSLELALQMQSEMIHMLGSGGFELHKWCANNAELLKNIPPELRDTSYSIDTDHSTASIKALGIHWQPKSDTFQFKVTLPDKPASVTKRTILSDTSRLFDPLGLVAPVIIVAKILMQQLWQLNISWDESVPLHLHTMWMHYRTQLFDLNQASIKRRVTQGTDTTSIELHGFSDASETSYGACVYLRCVGSNGVCSANLLCAKSRVSPLKKISLPRLELCGALVLARLISKVADALNQHCIKSINLWTDSTIVIHWLALPSNKWKTFVANRVSEIQSLTIHGTWRHVRSIDNPADILSRGATPKQLLKSDLWWSGPSWLSLDSGQWPTAHKNHEIPEPNILEERKQSIVACPVTQDPAEILNLESRFSCWYKLVRITALCKRFSKNSRLCFDQRQFGPLSVPELQEAEYLWIRSAQQIHFTDDLKSLNKNNEVKPSSKLRNLNPFVDQNGLLRVGGRLKNSDLKFNHKHPIILPEEHTVTKLILQREHIKSLHAGPQALLASIRRKYWPINGKILTRRIVRNCVNCFKVNPRSRNQLMGDLPHYRVHPSRPFLNCGVDYCGPIYARRMLNRRSPPVKTYIALFICMATKAIHLELVMDLTTEAFLAAFKRFISRRGKPTHIYCDNATTFVGAKNELSELRKLFLSETYQHDVARILAEDEITWKFIPARSPHFGGLWEAGVKTVKGHLKRMIGNAHLQFDELITLLCQIEACVNSRPITPLSSNPDDLLPLTPAHFLISDTVSTPAEPDLTSLSTNRLGRWQRGQQLLQTFWRRYSSEYLSSLQQRHKWSAKGEGIKLDSLVLIKEDFRPPLTWETGRIVTLHPGADGIVRVVTVKTPRGLFKRATNRLCPLPLE